MRDYLVGSALVLNNANQHTTLENDFCTAYYVLMFAPRVAVLYYQSIYSYSDIFAFLESGIVCQLYDRKKRTSLYSFKLFVVRSKRNKKKQLTGLEILVQRRTYP